MKNIDTLEVSKILYRFFIIYIILFQLIYIAKYKVNDGYQKGKKYLEELAKAKATGKKYIVDYARARALGIMNTH